MLLILSHFPIEYSWHLKGMISTDNKRRGLWAIITVCFCELLYESFLEEKKIKGIETPIYCQVTHVSQLLMFQISNKTMTRFSIKYMYR